MTVADVLNAAAGLVRARWWTKGDASGAGHCASTAINASRRADLGFAAHDALLRVIGHAPGMPYDAWPHIYAWNDAPGQTAENVAATLELAAIYWTAQQAIAPPALVEA